MNNEAFRALINKQRGSTSTGGGGEKSTKEIAREAVEAEIQRKRSRHGGTKRSQQRGGFNEGYGSDSGGSSDEDMGRHQQKKEKEVKDDNDEPEWKRRRREKKQQQQDGNEPQYRDRAKERRDGTNMDYQSLEGLTQSNEDDRRRQAELSQYLGGDIERTHLVKGLDKALASKVRREEMGQSNETEKDVGDLDQLFEDSYAQKKKKTALGSKDWTSSTPKTELGKSVAQYLLQKQKSTPTTTSSITTSQQVKTYPTIQKSIHSSILTYSLNGDTRQRKKAWEVPKMAIGSSHKNDIVQRKITPLNQHLIATISKKLGGGSSGIKETDTSKYITATNNSKQKEGADSAKAKLHQSGSSISSTTKDIKETNTSAIDKDKQRNLTVKDDDSDDDIFADVGNYVHQELKPKTSEGATSSEANDNGTQDVSTEDAPKKKSIFADLITETETVPQPRVQQQRLVQPSNQQQLPKKKNVIDRDIFGGKQDDATLPYQKRRGPQTSAMEGVSMNAYDGGYGEEHDVDFGGDEEYQKKKDEDKRKEAERLAEDGENDDDEEEG